MSDSLSTRQADIFFAPINLQAWISEHRKYLQPPVCNKLVFPASGGFIVMVVGGPNTRKDFHYEEGPELFYQIEGKMVLKIMQNNSVVDIPINAGEMFFLPPRIPHSPQRFEGSVGLVVERVRLAGEKDGLHWYCDLCSQLLYEEYFYLQDVESDFPPIFERFYSNPEHRSCKKCGFLMPLPLK